MTSESLLVGFGVRFQLDNAALHTFLRVEMVTRAEVARVDCLAHHRAQTYDLRLHRNPSRQENERPD